MKQFSENFKNPLFDIGTVASGALSIFQLGAIGAGEAGQEGALQDQIAETKIQASEQAINRNKQLENVLATNEARSSARGISMASGSFKAVQGESNANADKADRIAKINTAIRTKNIQDEIDAVHRKANASRFNALLNFGEGVLSLAAFTVI